MHVIECKFVQQLCMSFKKVNNRGLKQFAPDAEQTVDRCVCHSKK